MSILCIAAHPDDEVLGVGGTLARHADSGEDVHVCFLSDGVTSRFDDGDDQAQTEIEQRKTRAQEACGKIDVSSTSFHQYPDNQFDSVPLLDIVQTIEDELERQEPRIIYTHHYGDLNIDHELTCRATVTAARPLPGSPVEKILAYETPSASEWSVPRISNAFQPTTFVEIQEHLESKLEALSIYEDELRSHPHPRSKENIKRNARIWGAKAGFEAAEPFELMREVR